MESSSLKNELLYDPIRKKWVVSTPEEIIRQRLVCYMIDKLGYLPGLIAIEKELSQLPHLKMTSPQAMAKRRADILVYAKGTLTPLLLIECKAVCLTPAFAQQVIGYNVSVGAPYVALANEEQTMTGWYQADAGMYRFEQGLPAFNKLMLSAL